MKLEVLEYQPTFHPARRPPLLFVHGAYCAAWVWAVRFMPYLAARGFACHALSLRGHGASEGLLSWASLADYVDDVARTAACFDTPPVVVGHSMGGLVVQHYLARHPAAAAVLMSSVPPSGVASALLHLATRSPDILMELGVLQALGPHSVRPAVIHRAFFTESTPVAGIHTLMSRMQAESHMITAELMIPGWTFPKVARGTPTLVLGGDADAFLPSCAYEETARLFDADLRILPGAPHALMLDTAWWQRSADALVDWIDQMGL